MFLSDDVYHLFSKLHTVDEEFEVTAEMLIHGEIDDESSLEVEEALQTEEERKKELNGLQEVRMYIF